MTGGASVPVRLMSPSDDEGFERWAQASLEPRCRPGLPGSRARDQERSSLDAQRRLGRPVRSSQHPLGQGHAARDRGRPFDVGDAYAGWPRIGLEYRLTVSEATGIFVSFVRPVPVAAAGPSAQHDPRHGIGEDQALHDPVVD